MGQLAAAHLPCAAGHVLVRRRLDQRQDRERISEAHPLPGRSSASHRRRGAGVELELLPRLVPHRLPRPHYPLRTSRGNARRIKAAK